MRTKFPFFAKLGILQGVVAWEHLPLASLPTECLIMKHRYLEIKLVNILIRVFGQFPEGRLPNGLFPDGRFPGGPFPESISPTENSPKDSSPNGQFSERTIPQMNISPTDSSLNDISPNGHFPESRISFQE